MKIKERGIRTKLKEYFHIMDKGGRVLPRPKIGGGGNKKKRLPLRILRNLGRMLASSRVKRWQLEPIFTRWAKNWFTHVF